MGKVLASTCNTLDTIPSTIKKNKINSSSTVTKICMELAEIAKWIRAHIDLLEDPRMVPNTNTLCLKPPCNSSSREIHLTLASEKICIYEPIDVFRPIITNKISPFKMEKDLNLHRIASKVHNLKLPRAFPLNRISNEISFTMS